MLSNNYIEYVSDIRRYSERTRQIYSEVLSAFVEYSCSEPTDECLIAALTPTGIRNYEVHLLDDMHDGAQTVNLHLSVLSGFCKWLIKEGHLSANPVRMTPRPRTGKKLPTVYREESISEYFGSTQWIVDEPVSADKDMYTRRLARMIVSLLYGTGMRRSELISLTNSSVDLSRHSIRVHGKGDKYRIIPILPSLGEELDLYQRAALLCVDNYTMESSAPLLLTPTGRPLYPVYVDRVIKEELGSIPSITGRKSPHVLRHTIATELLDEGTDLNSIKEMLGHSSLAATQVYTHNSIEKLRKVYADSHPRATKDKD